MSEPEESIEQSLQWMAAEGFLNKVGADNFTMTGEGKDAAIEIMGGATVCNLADAFRDVLTKHGTLMGPLPEGFEKDVRLFFCLNQIALLLHHYGYSEPVLKRLNDEGYKNQHE